MVSKPRYRAVDACRGLALVYMLFNHGFRLTVSRQAMELEPGQFDWWTWLIAKAAPSLFFLCFGFMLGVLYINPERTFNFERVARRLWWRCLLVFLSYKLLVVLELAALGKNAMAMKMALQYRWLGQWVEILNFYAIVLLLSPPGLWLWRRLPWWSKVLVVLGVAWLTASWQGTPWSNSILQAILVGRQGYYVFPVLPWLLPVLLGTLLGEHYPRLARGGRLRVMLVCVVASGILFGIFLAMTGTAMAENLKAVLFSWKHPPKLAYLAWTTSYALLYLTAFFAVLGVEREPSPRWAVLETMGRGSLLQFNLHFTILFAIVGLGLHSLQSLPAVPARWCGVALVLTCMTIGVAWDEVAQRRKASTEASETAEESQ